MPACGGAANSLSAFWLRTIEAGPPGCYPIIGLLSQGLESILKNTRTVLDCFVSTLLLAALAACGSAQNPPPESKPQSSSEAGAGGNGQPAKRAKRVFTNDDFSSAHASGGGVDVSSQWSVDSFFPKTL